MVAPTSELALVRDWLDRFHAFAVDAHGSQSVHLLSRPTSLLAFELPGRWRTDQAALDKIAYSLHVELEDRIIPIGEFVQPGLQVLLRKADSALLGLHTALTKVVDERTDPARDFRLGQIYLNHHETMENTVRVLGEFGAKAVVSRKCPRCFEEFPDWKDLEPHFYRKHPRPRSGMARLLDPMEHLERVNGARKPCREVYRQIFESLARPAEVGRLQQIETPSSPRVPAPDKQRDRERRIKRILAADKKLKKSSPNLRPGERARNLADDQGVSGNYSAETIRKIITGRYQQRADSSQ